MSKDLIAIGNIGAGVTMLVAAIAWVVFGGKAYGLALCVGTTVGLTVFLLLAWQSIRHHSHNQPRDGKGRFVPVKERGQIVEWVLVDEKAGNRRENGQPGSETAG